MTPTSWWRITSDKAQATPPPRPSRPPPPSPSTTSSNRCVYDMRYVKGWASTLLLASPTLNCMTVIEMLPHICRTSHLCNMHPLTTAPADDGAASSYLRLRRIQRVCRQQQMDAVLFVAGRSAGGSPPVDRVCARGGESGAWAGRRKPCVCTGWRVRRVGGRRVQALTATTTSGHARRWRTHSRVRDLLLRQQRGRTHGTHRLTKRRGRPVVQG